MYVPELTGLTESPDGSKLHSTFWENTPVPLTLADRTAD